MWTVMGITIHTELSDSQSVYKKIHNFQWSVNTFFTMTMISQESNIIQAAGSFVTLIYLFQTTWHQGAWSSVVVKALRY
jgi:hypothetical protein